MKQTRRSSRRNPSTRRGAMMPVVAMVIPIIMIFVGYSINIAYMELAQTELRLTCDSAAKAALINYGATNSSSTAIAFGQSISSNNKVMGQSVTIPSSKFIFGNSTKQSNGSYLFTASGTPVNSVQVTGASSVTLPFGFMIASGKYSCSELSYATRVSYNIMLVLDRSASMAFDLSGNEFVYPADRTLYSPLQSYFTTPSPTASRWASLTSAVNTFITVIQSRNLNVNVGLVTYAENYTLGSYSSQEATLDVGLTTNYASILTAMNNYGSAPLLGDTNISAGLALAQSELTSSAATPTSDLVIILFTDGVATTGNTNIPSLTSSYRTGSNIMTHVITFGGEAASGTVQTQMQSAAQNGNGLFFNAATSAQLQSAFQTIADSLPAVLVN